MEKTEEKRWITFSRTFLLLTCYILTCVFFTVAKICTSKHKEQGSCQSTIGGILKLPQNTHISALCFSFTQGASFISEWLFIFKQMPNFWEPQTRPGHVWGHSDLNSDVNYNSTSNFFTAHLDCIPRKHIMRFHSIIRCFPWQKQRLPRFFFVIIRRALSPEFPTKERSDLSRTLCMIWLIFVWHWTTKPIVL